MSIDGVPRREVIVPGQAGLRDAVARRQQLADQLAARARRPGPLARHQSRLFTLWRLDRQSSAYHESVVLRLRGQLDHQALLAAVRSLSQRHEWLRSHIELRGAEAVQVLHDEPVLDVRVMSCSSPAGGPRDRLPAAARSWVEALSRDPFDLERGPVWRAGLASLGPQDNILVLVVHHVACDATALEVLLDEVQERYAAACSGVAPSLPPAASPRDVAARLIALQDSDTLAAAVSSHVDQLVGAEYCAPLAEQTHGGAGPAAVVTRRVPSELAARVRRVADEVGVSAFAVVTSAVAAGTSRSLGTSDLVLGVPVDLRWQLPSGEDVVAFLVETLALRLRAIPARSLAELAADVVDATGAALQTPLPFDAVVDELRARGELPPTGTPLHVYVNWLDGGQSRHLAAGGPSVTYVDEPMHDAKFELSWTVVSRGSELTLRLEHDSSRWDRPSAERLLDRALHVMDLATADASRPLGQLGLLLPDEAERISSWEGTAGPDPDTDLLTFVLDGLADEPGRILEGTAFASVGRDRLVSEIDRIAAALITTGVQPGDRVAVSGRRGSGMVIALLAVLRAGAAFVPLDESQPHARQLDLADRAAVRAVLGPGEWASRLGAALGVDAVDVERAVPGGGAPAEWPVRQPDSTAYVLYTSGSTGVPKAVRVSDGAVISRALSYRPLLSAQPVRYLLQSTLGFDASMYLFWVLASGGCLVLPSDDAAADPGRLSEVVRRFGVTDCFFVPTFYAALLAAAPPRALDSLLRVCVGGEVMPPALAARHAGVLPGTELLNVYGPTEVVTTSTAHTVSTTHSSTAAVPIGRPHHGTRARVLDATGHPVAVGAPGELHLGGPSVASGYDGSPGLSGPFSCRTDDHGRPVRWYATGDVVRWLEDGQLGFLGRRDRQVKVRGQRIELAEVEAAILRAPGVAAAAVHVLSEGGSARLGAVVAPTASGVSDVVAAQLPGAWVPERFVAVPTLPQTASGKVDRSAVGRLVEADLRRHAGPGTRTAASPGAPLTSVQAGVLSVVRDLLDDQELGMDDDFFAAGGNSLLAARLIGGLHELLGVTVQLQEVAVGPTARHIAATLGPSLDSTHVERLEPTVVTLRGDGCKAPLVIVAREGDASVFLRRVLQDLDPERPVHMLLRSMPAPGLLVPDLVESGREAARVLREHFPAGPVHLLGHSASGIVALETARSLGEPYGTTTLLDTTCPSRWSQRPYRWVAVSVLTARRRLGLVRRGRHPRQGGGGATASLRALRFYQEELANIFARIRPVHFPVTLVAVAESRAHARRCDLGWARHCSALTVVETSGQHITMLLKPDVEQTLDGLRRVLAGEP